MCNGGRVFYFYSIETKSLSRSRSWVWSEPEAVVKKIKKGEIRMRKAASENGINGWAERNNWILFCSLESHLWMEMPVGEWTERILMNSFCVSKSCDLSCETFFFFFCSEDSDVGTLEPNFTPVGLWSAARCRVFLNPWCLNVKIKKHYSYISLSGNPWDQVIKKLLDVSLPHKWPSSRQLHVQM